MNAYRLSIEQLNIIYDKIKAHGMYTLSYNLNDFLSYGYGITTAGELLQLVSYEKAMDFQLTVVQYATKGFLSMYSNAKPETYTKKDYYTSDGRRCMSAGVTKMIHMVVCIPPEYKRQHIIYNKHLELI